MKNILIVSTCKYSLSEIEFVNPLKYIIEEESIQHSIIHISKINEFKYIKEISHIIFCGTAIKDFSYTLYNIDLFLEEIKKREIPTLGICAGAQIISKFLQIPLEYNFQSNMSKFKAINPSRKLNISKGEVVSGYVLHSYSTNFNSIKQSPSYKSITPVFQTKSSQLIELLEIYNFCVSFFHLEIKNKNIIRNWINNNTHDAKKKVV